MKTTGAAVSAGLVAGCMGGNGNGNGGNGGNGNGGNGNGDDDGGPITIAGLQPMSGNFSVYGPAHTAGVEFAIDRINANGGVLGRDLEVQTVDTGGSAQDAVTSFTQMIEQDGVVAGLGPVATEAAIQAGEVADDMEVPLFMHAAGAAAVTPTDSRYRFRTALAAAPTCAAAQAQIAEANGYTEIGMIIEDGEWGYEYETAVEALFPDDVTLETDFAPIPENDFIPYLRDMPDEVDMFLGAAHPAGINSIVEQMDEIGMSTDLFVGAITPASATYGALGDHVADSFAYFHQIDPYTDEYEEIATEFYEEEGGLFDTAEASGYATVEIIADAVEGAGTTDPVEVAEEIRTGSFETIFASPVEYTEWGELDNVVQVYNSFDVGEAPSYYPDGEFRLEEFHRTDPIEAHNPDELGI
ncbi:ABC transporter substrate-binding protein [Natrarchaeobius sp. A-rgal3]|uniref:ABC transporter substrate-binding protein n=1 Tax=Natrarchaeobius versutus TaxID=1679078 RepID=UPI00350F1E63